MRAGMEADVWQMQLAATPGTPASSLPPSPSAASLRFLPVPPAATWASSSSCSSSVFPTSCASLSSLPRSNDSGSDLCHLQEVPTKPGPSPSKEHSSICEVKKRLSHTARGCSSEVDGRSAAADTVGARLSFSSRSFLSSSSSSSSFSSLYPSYSCSPSAGLSSSFASSTSAASSSPAAAAWRPRKGSCGAFAISKTAAASESAAALPQHPAGLVSALPSASVKFAAAYAPVRDRRMQQKRVTRLVCCVACEGLSAGRRRASHSSRTQHTEEGSGCCSTNSSRHTSSTRPTYSNSCTGTGSPSASSHHSSSNLECSAFHGEAASESSSSVRNIQSRGAENAFAAAQRSLPSSGAHELARVPAAERGSSSCGENSVVCDSPGRSLDIAATSLRGCGVHAPAASRPLRSDGSAAVCPAEDSDSSNSSTVGRSLGPNAATSVPPLAGISAKTPSFSFSSSCSSAGVRVAAPSVGTHVSGAAPTQDQILTSRVFPTARGSASAKAAACGCCGPRDFTLCRSWKEVPLPEALQTLYRLHAVATLSPWVETYSPSRCLRRDDPAAALKLQPRFAAGPDLQNCAAAAAAALDASGPSTPEGSRPAAAAEALAPPASDTDGGAASHSSDCKVAAMDSASGSVENADSACHQRLEAPAAPPSRYPRRKTCAPLYPQSIPAAARAAPRRGKRSETLPQRRVQAADLSLFFPGILRRPLPHSLRSKFAGGANATTCRLPPQPHPVPSASAAAAGPGASVAAASGVAVTPLIGELAAAAVAAGATSACALARREEGRLTTVVHAMALDSHSMATHKLGAESSSEGDEKEAGGSACAPRNAWGTAAAREVMCNSERLLLPLVSRLVLLPAAVCRVDMKTEFWRLDGEGDIPRVAHKRSTLQISCAAAGRERATGKGAGEAGEADTEVVESGAERREPSSNTGAQPQQMKPTDLPLEGPTPNQGAASSLLQKTDAAVQRRQGRRLLLHATETDTAWWTHTSECGVAVQQTRENLQRCMRPEKNTERSEPQETAISHRHVQRAGRRVNQSDEQDRPATSPAVSSSVYTREEVPREKRRFCQEGTAIERTTFPGTQAGRNSETEKKDLQAAAEEREKKLPLLPFRVAMYVCADWNFGELVDEIPDYVSPTRQWTIKGDLDIEGKTCDLEESHCSGRRSTEEKRNKGRKKTSAAGARGNSRCTEDEEERNHRIQWLQEKWEDAFLRLTHNPRSSACDARNACGSSGAATGELRTDACSPRNCDTRKSETAYQQSSPPDVEEAYLGWKSVCGMKYPSKDGDALPVEPRYSSVVTETHCGGESGGTWSSTGVIEVSEGCTRFERAQETGAAAGDGELEKRGSNEGCNGMEGTGDGGAEGLAATSAAKDESAAEASKSCNEQIDVCPLYVDADTWQALRFLPAWLLLLCVDKFESV